MLWGSTMNKTNALPSKCLRPNGETDKKYTGKPVYTIPERQKRREKGRELRGVVASGVSGKFSLWRPIWQRHEEREGIGCRKFWGRIPVTGENKHKASGVKMRLGCSKSRKRQCGQSRESR